MGKCGSVVILVGALLLLISGSAGCGSSRPSTGATPPASITLSPSSASLDLGQTQQFTATAQNSSKTPIAVTLTYSSSNTAVLTISNAGLACAGSWDSLINPITCTPGPAGVASVTASSEGVVSPPVTVYVHQHVDNISITPVNPPSPNCNPHANAVGISQKQTANYQAVALSRGIDVTSTVGPFNWTAASASVVKLNSAASGLLSNQVQATAGTPGITQISASAAQVSSAPVDFQTCPVKSITLTGSAGSENTVSIIKGSTSSITATVTDSLNTVLSGVPLTWCSSEPAAVSVGSGNCSSSSTNPISVTGELVGGSDVTASCTPPSCNEGILDSAPNGILHSLPIYPDQAIAITVNPTSQTSTQQTTSAYVATTKCGNNFGCTSSIVGIAVPGNNVSSSTTLPNTPNSLVFDRQGKNAFLGSENGLMMFVPANIGASSGAVSVFNKVTGKVLAVSSNGNKVIISDTLATPNLVFVFDVTNTGSPVTLLISGATAAAFSPDSLKGYIVAGNKLYVYSAVDALQTVTLSTPATDLTFLPAGGFAYVAGGSGSTGSITPVTTCTNALNATVATSGLPFSIRPVLDGTQLLALVPSGIDVISATVTPPGVCSPPLSTSVPRFVNLGQGQFTPARFLVSSDGTKAYVLASNLGAVLVYDVAAGTSSAIPLTGNVTAVNGDLTLDGSSIYVAASDGSVHAVSTVSGGDIQTISFPTNFTFCNNVTFTCNPDLVAVQP
jgi:Bacterial Ig-like domain (group 2)